MKINSTISFSVLIGVSIFFKILFFSFLTISSRPLSSNYPSFHQETLKIGKKRRRTICHISRAEESSINEEQIFAEKTETESSNELLKRLKLPFLSFFAGCLSFIDAQIKTGISCFLDPPNSISTKKYLSVSVLRI